MSSTDSGPRGLVFRALQRGFLAKNRWKPRLRRPVQAVSGLVRQRKAYGHIPEAPKDAAARDKAVWDHLSDQPHQHASRRERAAIRIADAPVHLAAMSAVVRIALAHRVEYPLLKIRGWWFAGVIS